MKFSRESIKKDILIMRGYAEFIYNAGDKPSSWRWLFLREIYKDFLKP